MQEHISIVLRTTYLLTLELPIVNTKLFQPKPMKVAGL